jgi:hypothetical protein
MFAEMGLLPIHYHWFCRMVSGTVSSSVTSLYGSLQRFAGRGVVHHEHRPSHVLVPTLGWAGQFLGVCAAIGVDVWEGFWEGVPDDAVTALSRAEWLLQRHPPAAHLCSRFREMMMGAWDLPRLDPSPAEVS